MRLKINHYLGGIFLIAGTTIGVGMLGTPVVTGFSGFIPSLSLFAFCWLIMLCSAFFFLDVNLSLRGEPNMISMAGKTLGTIGKAVSWVVYLLLFYSLLAAYISASAPLFSNGFTALTGWEVPPLLAPFFLPLLFGGFIYLGTLGVDMVNRFLMVGLLVSYFLLIGSTQSSLSMDLLEHADFKALPVAVTVILTSFGYHIIIPSLTTYMNHDRKHLILTIVFGSLLSLLAYSVFQLIALGTVPIPALTAAFENSEPVTAALAKVVQNKTVATLAHFFSFFAIITSFLGVSLSLSDFLTDGFKIKKTWEGRLIAISLTFVPPIVFVMSYPKGFYKALEYSGALVAILLILLPALMAFKLKKPTFYRSAIGRLVLCLVALFAIGVVILDIFEQLGALKPLISRYV